MPLPKHGQQLKMITLIWTEFVLAEEKHFFVMNQYNELDNSLVSLILKLTCVYALKWKFTWLLSTLKNGSVEMVYLHKHAVK